MQTKCEHHDSIPVMSGASAKISVRLRRRNQSELSPEHHSHHHHHHGNDGWSHVEDFSEMEGRRLFIFLVCCDDVVWKHEVEEMDFHNGVVSIPMTSEDTALLEDRVCKVQIAMEKDGEVLAGVHFNDDIYIHFKKWEAGRWLARHTR